MAMGGEEKIRIVESLHEGLAIGDNEAVAALPAADLDWWIHGPPGCQHMMRILTGKVTEEEEVEFRFEPKKMVEVGGGRGVRRGHSWAGEDGIITRSREYINTWGTVRELGRPVQAQPMPRRLGGPADTR